jgi:hypothetical protein
LESNERARIVITPKIWSPPLHPSWQKGASVPDDPPKMQDFLHVCSLKIMNSGNTPALIDEIAAAYIHVLRPLAELPRNPKFRERFPQGGRLLLDKNDITIDQTLGPKGTLTATEIMAIQNNDAFLYVYASVKYRDVYKKRRKTLVGYTYFFPQNGLASIQKAAFDVAGPKTYNQST